MTDATKLSDKELIARINEAADKVVYYNEKIDKATARMIGHAIGDFIPKVAVLIKELGNRPETIYTITAVQKFRLAVHKTNELVKLHTA